jgi:signal transduction histidine kinase
VSSPTILVVEPNATLLDTITDKVLRPNGFNPLATQRMDEGRRIAIAAAPDLLLLHAPIPHIETMLAQVVKLRQPIPTILVVEQSDIQISITLLKAGVKDYITWPPVPDDLLHAINQVLKQPEESGKNGVYTNFEFADMVSHLTRNPLNIIQTSAECLRTLELSPAEQNNLQDKIRQQSQRLTSFTNELLRTLRSDIEGSSICAMPVELIPLIDNVVNYVGQEKPGLTVKFVPPAEDIPTVAIDSTKTELIILNLLISAVRRSYPDGEITIAIKATTTEVIVSIKDNGKPIPIEPIDNIFQPFYAPDKSRLNMPSTYHLGLYATKRWIELQNGRIWAEALTSGGSQFFFSLPVWEPKT